MTDAVELDSEQAIEQRHYWHIDRFCELGFERHQAEILELAEVDWRDAQDLIDKGCPFEVAILILS